MTLIHHISPDGSFTCGDTETGLTAYAYPTSQASKEAKRDPLRVAQRMLSFEMPRETLAKIASQHTPHRYDSVLSDFLQSDARHWKALGDAWAMVEA